MIESLIKKMKYLSGIVITSSILFSNCLYSNDFNLNSNSENKYKKSNLKNEKVSDLLANQKQNDNFRSCTNYTQNFNETQKQVIEFLSVIRYSFFKKEFYELNELMISEKTDSKTDLEQILRNYMRENNFFMIDENNINSQNMRISDEIVHDLIIDGESFKSRAHKLKNIDVVFDNFLVTKESIESNISYKSNYAFFFLDNHSEQFSVKYMANSSLERYKFNKRFNEILSTKDHPLYKSYYHVFSLNSNKVEITQFLYIYNNNFGVVSFADNTYQYIFKLKNKIQNFNKKQNTYSDLAVTDYDKINLDQLKNKEHFLKILEKYLIDF